MEIVLGGPNPTNGFIPRWYQRSLLDAIWNRKIKKCIIVNPRRCLSGDSHILMANGSYKLLRDINIGDMILSWDGDKFVEDKVVNKWSTGKKETVSVQSSRYLPLKTSLDHVFATTWSGKDQLLWKKAADLSKKSLLLNYAGSSFGTINDDDLAEFYGYMLADGYVSGYQQPKFTNNNPEILDRVQYLAEKLFDVTTIRRPKGNGFDLGFSNGTKGGGYTSNPIKELFRNDGLDVPKSKKRLPPILWDMNEKSLGRYFAGLLSADGNIYRHKKGFTASDSNNKIPPSIEVSIHCGESYELAWDIYWLLRKVGIVSQNPTKEKKSNWKIRISKSVDITKILSFGPIYGKQDKQNDALNYSKLAIKKASVWKGCYRSGYKKKSVDSEELFDIETEKNHNFVANGYVVHNSGKDILCWTDIVIPQALRERCLIYYCLPTFSQGRRIIWDAIDNDGKTFKERIDPRLIYKINDQRMSITLHNGSIIQIIGANDATKTLIGTNPKLIIFSEFGSMINGKEAFSLVRPIIAANGGKIIIVSTPRGRNHLWELYENCKTLPDWYVEHNTTEGPNGLHHIAEDVLAQEKAQMDPGLFEQEYNCSWTKGISGQVFGWQLEQMIQEERICHVPWLPDTLVNVSMDIGVRDSTSILWYQVVNDGQTVRIIDSYSNNNLGLDHYVKVLQDKPYRYNPDGYYAPHDMAVRDWSTGAQPRFVTAQNLGIDFTILPQMGFQDSIDKARLAFNRVWIDEKKCKGFIASLENYRYEWNEERQDYSDKPVRNFATHYADAYRYLAQSLELTKKGMTAEEFNNQKARALYGSGTPSLFKDPRGWGRP